MSRRNLLSSFWLNPTQRLLWLLLGGTCAGGAVWVFYVRDWLNRSTPLDTWLDRNDCLIKSLCTPQFDLPNHPAILMALLAVFFFSLALYRLPALWRHTEPVELPLAWAERGWTSPLIVGSVIFALGMVIIQAVQTLQGAAPSLQHWLLGMGACLLAASLWDSHYPDNLNRTLANLSVGGGMLLIILGVAAMLALRPDSVPLLILGFLAFGVGSYGTVRLGSTVSPLEHIGMLGLALLALILTISRAWSWQFAFIGDEWTFFETARTILHQPNAFNLLALRDAVGYHTILSFAAQSWIMQLMGENVFGWRLASSLPFVLSIPPTYIFIRWLAGRGAALLGAGLLTSAHILQTFSMAAYNNTQALLPLTVGLGLLAFAAVRGSVLRYTLLGLLLGLGQFTFGVARLTLIPIGLMLLVYFFPLKRDRLPGWLPVGLGGLVASTPILFNLGNWQALLKATPAQSEVAQPGLSLVLQLVHNSLLGGLAFLTNSHQTHFIAGPHADPLTAILVLGGLGFLLGSLNSAKHARVWLAASGLFVLTVSAIQQYGFVSPTRMFILPPIYAIYAGLGGQAILSLLFPQANDARNALIGFLIAVAMSLNLFHVETISLPKSLWSVETLIMNQLQATAAPDRGGMPVFLVMEPHRGLRLAMIARGYDVGRERLVILSPPEALELPELCEATSEPAMVLVDVRTEQAAAMRQRIANCWTNYTESAIYNQAGEVWLYRFFTQNGQTELTRPQRDRRSFRQAPDSLAVHEPGDIAIDKSGNVFILSPTNDKIYRFDSAGGWLPTVEIDQQDVSALALSSEGYLLVASAYGTNRLSWYAAAGHLVRQLRDGLNIGRPRGLAVRPNGEILIADEEGGRIVRLSPQGELIVGEYTAGGRLGRPLSVAADFDGSIWVADADGQLVHISPFDELLASYPLSTISVDRMQRILPMVNGEIVLTDPDNKRVVRLNGDGQLRRVWYGLERPVAAAVDGQGRLFVADLNLDEVAIFPPIFAAPQPLVTVPIEAPTPTPTVSTPEIEPPTPASQSEPTLEVIKATNNLTLLAVAAPNKLNEPRSIAVGPTGMVYVADTGQQRLLIFDEAKRFKNQLLAGSTPFVEPVDVALDSRGQVYLLDAGAGTLSIFTAEGAYLLDVPLDQAYLRQSRGLFIDQLDRIWIASTARGRLLGADLAGNMFLEFPPQPGQDTQPVDVAVSSDGDIFATDGILHQLLHFNQAGEPLNRWDLTSNNTVAGPHLTIGPDDTLYLTDPQEGVIQRLKPDRGDLDAWPLSRMVESPMHPVGLDIDAEERIWAVDPSTNRIIILDTSAITPYWE